GCYDAAVALRTPFISGKDSFYNEFAYQGKTISIPGTILISAMGIVENIEKTVTMDFKEKDNLIYVVGDTLDEMGGSIYYDTFGKLGNSVPHVNFKNALKIFTVLQGAIQKGLVRAAHDCSEGGLAVALSEMAFAGGFGASVFLAKVPFKGKKAQNDIVLFSESNSRFVVEVAPSHQKNFENVLKGINFGLVGQVKTEKIFTVYGLKGEACVTSNIQSLKQSWQKTLRW
ncbi:MAG: AIR synthase-related protein, partial [Candidatus Omnitrophica bacterium]|nr:AIR synthase-related protein [Candidatus Omnitrophota bacterium]